MTTSTRSAGRGPAEPSLDAPAAAGLDRGQVAALLDAVVAVGGDGGLDATLERLTRSACVLVGARYGALGVLAQDGSLARFLTHGVSDAERAAIGRLPRGRGVLGTLVREPGALRLHDLTQHPDAVGFPAHHPPMRTFLGVPVRVRGELFGILYVAEKAGGEDFTAQDEAMASALAAAAGVSIEAARLVERSHHREAWLEAMVQIERALLEGPPRGEVLGTIVRRACELARADVALLVLPADPDHLVVDAVHGEGAALLRGLVVDRSRSLSGAVIRSDRPELVADLAADPRAFPLPGERPQGPALFVPMSSSGAVLGTLVVVRHRGGEPFGPADVELVGTFARHATLALELATVQDQRLRLAVYEERDRIARDLHDVVIQRLFGAGLTVQSMLPRLPDGLRDGGERLVDDLDEAVRELRTAIFALHRPDAGGAGVRGRLHDLVHAVTEPLGHRPRLRLVGPLDALVGERLADHALAVVGEALTNVARHAHAGATSVHVTADAGELVVEVTDDGVGLPDVVEAPGEGLHNLRSRAAELGGTCEVGRRAGGGTRVEWRVPLAP